MGEWWEKTKEFITNLDWRITAAAITVIVGLIIWMVVAKDNPSEGTKLQIERTVVQMDDPQTNIFDKKLHVVIQGEFQQQALGSIVEGYQFGEGYYLVITKKDDKNYNKTFPGDRIIWAKESEGEVLNQELTTGDYLISLITKKDDPSNPFLSYGGKTYFIYYEWEGLPERGKSKKGYVYEVLPNGSLKKTYETKGVFGGVKVSKNEELMILDKTYLEDRGMYPTSLRPYEVTYIKVSGAEVEVAKKEVKEPAKEKYEELDIGSDLQAGELKAVSEKK